MLWIATAIITSFIALAAAPKAGAQYYATMQLEEKTVPVGDFTGINATDDFEITLSKGPCGAKVTCDKMLAPYVQVYVRSRVLYVTYDQKAVPKDVRKLYKGGRNAVKPIFRIQVSLPALEAVELTENASLVSADLFDGAQPVINLTDKSQIKNLNISANGATVTLKKNAQATLSLKAINKIELKTEANANLKASTQCHDLIAEAAGQSEQALTAEGENASLTATGSAKMAVSHKGRKMVVQMGASADIALTGEGEELVIRGERNAELEAGGFTAQQVDASLSGSSEANVSVVKLLDATLIGGSELYYTGTPEFRIGKVIKSTLAPYGATAK